MHSTPSSPSALKSPRRVAGPREAGLRRVAGPDGLWLQDSPANLMLIQTLLTVDHIDLESFRQLWVERVMEADGGRRYPRFTQRVVTVGRKAYWQEAADFDLANHVFVPTGAADLGTEEKLQEYIGRKASEPLPEDRPRWQVQLIPEFGDGRSAVLIRIHHCMGDGIGLIPIVFSLLDSESGGMVMPAVLDKKGKPPNKALLGLRALAAGPFLLAQKFLWVADRSPLHGPELAGTKRVAWTGPIDLGLIKVAKNRLGATVNDVLVACVVGGLRRYVEGRGEELRQLRVSMPVNMRSRHEKLRMDNKFAAVLLALPVAAGWRQQIAGTRRSMNRLKRSIEPVFTFVTGNLMLKTLPRSMSRRVIDFLANKCSCVLTNVPGPQEPAYVAGRRLRSMLFWVPQRARIGIGISIFTLAGTVRIGVIADTALVPDPEPVVEAFEEEIRRLGERVGAGG